MLHAKLSFSILEQLHGCGLLLNSQHGLLILNNLPIGSRVTLSWSHCFCCWVVIPMLPFLTGHWWINEQVAKRQCNYIDGVSLQNKKKRESETPSYAYKYTSFWKIWMQNLHPKKITFFHLHRGRFTYTSFELVKRVGAHYSHGAVSLPNPGAYRPAG